MITVTSIGIADRFPVQSLRHASRYRIRIDAKSTCFLARNIKDHLSIMQRLSKENSDAGFVILQVSSRLRSAVPDYSASSFAPHALRRVCLTTHRSLASPVPIIARRFFSFSFLFSMSMIYRHLFA